MFLFVFICVYGIVYVCTCVCMVFICFLYDFYILLYSFAIFSYIFICFYMISICFYIFFLRFPTISYDFLRYPRYPCVSLRAAALLSLWARDRPLGPGCSPIVPSRIYCFWGDKEFNRPKIRNLTGE